MPKSRFTRAQRHDIVLQKEAGTPVRKLCCQHDVSHAAIYAWHRRWLKEQADPINPMKRSDAVQDSNHLAAAESTIKTPVRLGSSKNTTKHAGDNASP